MPTDKNAVLDLLAAVDYALKETEHLTDPVTGRAYLRLQRLDCPDGVFAWLALAKQKVQAQFSET